MVIADDEGKSIWIGQHIMDVVNSMGAEAVPRLIPGGKLTGNESPASVAVAMKSVTLSFRFLEEREFLIRTPGKNVKHPHPKGAALYSPHRGAKVQCLE